jgi:DNA-dependent RNA polymerase-like protein
MSETRLRSNARFNKRNRLWTAKNRPRQFIQTPLGRALTDEFFAPLTDFLAGRLDEQPHDPPGFLRGPIQQLADPSFLALAGVATLMDRIFRGWDRDDPSAEARLKLKVGDDLYQRLRTDPKVTLSSRWGAKQRVQAGDWLLRQALALDIFGYDDDGFPCISDKWKPDVAQIRERLIAAGAVFAPLLKPPPPWTGWSKSYDDGFRARFVRDWRPETKAAIDVAFLNPTFEHARGVDALARVPLKIDPVMLDLVERYAVEIMGDDGSQRLADQTTVAADVADARWCGDRAIWNDYNCDRRGRIYALQHLNFTRGDHVRSLFRFANGMKLGGDTYWLEIHCANCEGSTDKEPRGKRIAWVHRHRREITDIAADPVGTFDKWRKADSPFAYVAACRELAAAWDDPDNFVTHLPIGFDGSANGLQHLALLSGDWLAASMVNLLASVDVPVDAYKELIAKAHELIAGDDCDHARWWRERFDLLSQKQQRKLLKQPIMTFAYSVTAAGATLQIARVYGGFRQNAKPATGAFGYLARKVLEACGLVLTGPKSVMDYICAVAEHCAEHGRFLEWTSPSGFPVANRYQKHNTITVTCLRGSVRVAQHKVADDVTDQIDHGKVVAAAAPNFVHSLDAAHLIKVVNAAVGEGITNLLTVHDCYYCLAPQATRLHALILEELADIYRDNDPLAELRRRNVSVPDILPVPPKGEICIWPDGSSSERTPLPLELVKNAKHAFG